MIYQMSSQFVVLICLLCIYGAPTKRVDSIWPSNDQFPTGTASGGCSDTGLSDACSLLGDVCNRGTCMSQGCTYVCICPANYGGKFCQTVLTPDSNGKTNGNGNGNGHSNGNGNGNGKRKVIDPFGGLDLLEQELMMTSKTTTTVQPIEMTTISNETTADATGSPTTQEKQTLMSLTSEPTTPVLSDSSTPASKQSTAEVVKMSVKDVSIVSINGVTTDSSDPTTTVEMASAMTISPGTEEYTTSDPLLGDSTTETNDLSTSSVLSFLNDAPASNSQTATFTTDATTSLSSSDKNTTPTLTSQAARTAADVTTSSGLSVKNTTPTINTQAATTAADLTKSSSLSDITNSPTLTSQAAAVVNSGVATVLSDQLSDTSTETSSAVTADVVTPTLASSSSGTLPTVDKKQDSSTAAIEKGATVQVHQGTSDPSPSISSISSRNGVTELSLKPISTTDHGAAISSNGETKSASGSTNSATIPDMSRATSTSSSADGSSSSGSSDVPVLVNIQNNPTEASISTDIPFSTTEAWTYTTGNGVHKRAVDWSSTSLETPTESILTSEYTHSSSAGSDLSTTTITTTSSTTEAPPIFQPASRISAGTIQSVFSKPLHDNILHTWQTGLWPVLAGAGALGANGGISTDTTNRNSGLSNGDIGHASSVDNAQINQTPANSNQGHATSNTRTSQTNNATNKGHTLSENGNGNGHTPSDNGNGNGHTPSDNGNGNNASISDNGNGHSASGNNNEHILKVNETGNGQSASVNENGNGNGHGTKSTSSDNGGNAGVNGDNSQLFGPFLPPHLNLPMMNSGGLLQSPITPPSESQVFGLLIHPVLTENKGGDNGGSTPSSANVRTTRTVQNNSDENGNEQKNEKNDINDKNEKNDQDEEATPANLGAAVTRVDKWAGMFPEWLSLDSQRDVRDLMRQSKAISRDMQDISPLKTAPKPDDQRQHEPKENERSNNTRASNKSKNVWQTSDVVRSTSNREKNRTSDHVGNKRYNPFHSPSPKKLIPKSSKRMSPAPVFFDYVHRYRGMYPMQFEYLEHQLRSLISQASLVPPLGIPPHIPMGNEDMEESSMPHYGESSRSSESRTRRSKQHNNRPTFLMAKDDFHNQDSGQS